ncbi:MAG: hypothetical protein IJ583_04970 [Firmicutes bacterium]|nr:hypothetical protein [Bacillota bacterium]
MELFGLNDSTGVEIYELYDSMEDYPTKISSPEYKEFLYHVIDPDMPESDLKWYDGDTIRTAIGQCMNNYTAANMAKYVTTLANGGKRYPLHFLNEITTNDGELVRKYDAQPELVIDIKPENLQAVYEGMYLVTSGNNGTLTNYFRNYPIKVAAKSGTAEQVPTRSEYTTFIGFAPYEDPQIALDILLPYGDDSTGPAPNIAKDVIASYMRLESTEEKMSYNTLSQ